MLTLDYLILAVYLAGVIGVGVYFYRRNEDIEDFFVGGRRMGPWHVGLSVVATDVGGGFSIGLGGLGFSMGLSGSWLLFTGLVGAWLAAVLIIPRIKRLDREHGMLSYPDLLRLRYGPAVATAAAALSGVGYLGFTGGQVLAGAKLAAGTLMSDVALLGLDGLQLSLVVIAVVIVGYTVLGGLRAVIFTDTIQWIVLLVGLVGFAIPFALRRIGGIAALRAELPPGHLSLLNVTPMQLLNWSLAIVPIWLIAMTLYQRIFACETARDARKAWFIAGLFEWPVMAFMGALLGACGRVLFPEVEPELGLPMTIKTVLPVGLTGLVVAAYFSAIMSTADSCLMASSGNVVGDVVTRYVVRGASKRQVIRLSQATTLVLGVLAVVIAGTSARVLDLILQAYSFMVGGLTVPTAGAYFWRRSTPAAAMASMLLGGASTLLVVLSGARLPLGLDPSALGLVVSAATFVPVSLLSRPGLSAT